MFVNRIVAFVFFSAFSFNIVQADAAFPLKVSEDGRRFVDSNNQPFFVTADTGWSIFSGVSKDDVKYYLDDRQTKGFNTILCSALHFWKDGRTPWQPQHQFYQWWAFDGDHYNLTQPNADYWRHVDWVINEAAKRNMFLMIAPCWFRYQGDAWYLHLNEDNAKRFSGFLAERYKGQNHIAWLLGGDLVPGKQLGNVKIMGQTLKRIAPNHLISYHANGLQHGSRQWFEGEDWFDFSTIQTNRELHPQEYQDVISDYDKQPVMPTWNGEPRYEGMTGGTPFAMRQQAYRGALNGGLGVAYGAGNLFNMGFTDTDWKNEILPLPGASDMQHIKAMFELLDWTKLTPHHKRPFLLDGQGAKDNYLPAASAFDGSWGVTYFPKQCTVKIDLTNFSGDLAASWFDPGDGSMRAVKDQPVTGQSAMKFETPGVNQSGDPDWVLILKSKK